MLCDRRYPVSLIAATTLAFSLSPRGLPPPLLRWFVRFGDHRQHPAQMAAKAQKVDGVTTFAAAPQTVRVPPVRSLPVDVRVGAYGVIVADDRILLTHWNELGRTGWTLPGGGMQEYETPQQAAVREIREETGFDTEILDILGVDSMYLTPADRMVAGNGPLHALRIVFRARIVGGSLTHEIGGSSDEARWVPLADVAALPTVSLVGIALHFHADRG